MTPETILFQPPNRIGLGHLSRLIAIALEVRRLAPDTRLPFLVEGEGHGLVETYDFPEINLPGAHDLYKTSRWAAWTHTERHVIVLETAIALVRSLAPSLIVFDCFPNAAVASAAIDQGIPIAFSLRKLRQMSSHFEAIQRLDSAVSLILIPHEEGECEIPPDLQSRTRFTGSIVRPAPPDVVDHVVPRPGSRLVVISGGGGGYPGTAQFYNLAIQAFVRARGRTSGLEGLLVTGPLFKDWWDLRLAEGIRVIPFDAGLSNTFAAADLVLCQAGYNTVAELTALGVPSIAVPAPRDSDDQYERACASARASPNFAVYQGEEPEALATLMIKTLDRAPLASRTPRPAPGATCAAASLLNLLSANRGHS